MALAVVLAFALAVVPAGCARPPALREPARGPVPPDERVLRYEVTGRTAAELRAQLDALGPRDDEGRRHDAVTRWSVSWVNGSPVDGRCAPLARFEHSIEIVLPEWRPSGAVDRELMKRWNRFVQALHEHESAHAAIVRQALAPMRAEIEQAGCAEANAVGYRALEQIRHTHGELDERTAHGALTGAVFP